MSIINNEHIREELHAYVTNFDHIPYGIAIVKNDDISEIIEANAAFYQLIGYTKEQFVEKHNNRLTDILMDSLYDIVEKRPIEGDYDMQWDLRIRRADGGVVWAHDYIHYHAKSDVFFITFMDITDKMIATARDLSYDAFQTRNAIISYLSLYTNEHIAVTDAITDKVVYMNPAASKLLGFHIESDWMDKFYWEIGFGTLDAVPDCYYEPLSEDEFTVREYYNQFHKKYVNVKSKIVNVPSLHRKMCVHIITDITSKKKLEQGIALQKTIHKCIDSLFTATTTDKVSATAYDDILNCLKEYYVADRAFIFTFKTGTYEVDNYHDVYSKGLKKLEYTLPIIVNEREMKLIQAISDVKISNHRSILDALNKENKELLVQLYKDYQIDNFSCVVVNNGCGDIVAFIGVVNAQSHGENKEIMGLLSRFIRMFIEHQENQQAKVQAQRLEAISKRIIVEKAAKNFHGFTHFKKNIEDILESLCIHFDADFAVILTKNEDGTCIPSYIGGQNVPDLSPYKNQASSIMERWVKVFEQKPKFISDIDFVDFKTTTNTRILNEEFGIYNFIVSPIKGDNDTITGMLFVNNFNLLNRSRLVVHIISNSISEYLAKVRIHQETQLEPATKLMNKVATQKQISDFLEKKKTGAVFIVDVDYFKELNDTLGHQVGDQAIIDIAGSLKQIFQSTDIIGRVGGDEFMVFSPNTISVETIEKNATQILEKCHRHYEKDGRTAEISVSIGVCCVDSTCQSFQCLYEKADNALYTSKENGKNQYCIYTEKY